MDIKGDTERIFIESVDSSLEVVEDLSILVNYPLSLVYRVKMGGEDYILKASHLKGRGSVSSDELRELARSEIEALSRACNVTDVPSLEFDFGEVSDYRLILKEFIPGKSLKSYPGPLSPKVKHMFRQTVSELHRLGITNLDLRDENIIITPDKSRAVLVDLCGAEFRDKLHGEYYENTILGDLEQIGKLLEG